MKRGNGRALTRRPILATLPPVDNAAGAHISERSWQGTVLDLFRFHGWRCYHTHDSRRSAAGFPDLVCVHPQRGCVFCELKRETGRLSPSQTEWLDALSAAGQRVFVLRPSSWRDAVAIAQGAPS